MTWPYRSGTTLLLSALALSALAAPPTYQIIDIGVINTTDTASQAFRISSNGIATGRSFRTGGTGAYTFTAGGGIVGLPNLTSPSRPFSVGNGVNNNGVVVGVGATTSFGSSRLPLIWQNGTVSQLTLPNGQTLGDANDVNDSNVAVGSVNSGVAQRGVIYSGGSASIISAALGNGTVFNTAFAINNSGLTVGSGFDTVNAAVTDGLVYDPSTNTTIAVGALTAAGHNSAICFDVNNNGMVVGSSSLNSGADVRAFFWTLAGGMTEIVTPTGTSNGIARGVNQSGWVVGNSSNAFSVPWLYDGTTTYRLADLVPANSGWDLAGNTSNSAMSISDNGTIVGTSVFNGQTHAYMMTPVPEPSTVMVCVAGLALLRRRRRKG